MILLWVMFCLPWGNTRATTFLDFQSTALGNGWFQYRMSVDIDPFFSEADVTQLQIGFTNEIDHGSADTNWINSTWGASYSSWTFGAGSPSRPYTETCLVRSSKTAYRLGTTAGHRATVAFILTYSEMNPLADDVSGNIGGYASMPCLIPCDPAEADGSPATVNYALKLVPDVDIHQLIQTNGNIYGVEFDWDYQSTFVLQGSADFKTWTNIAYLWSSPPETLWTTNVALNRFGSFFRVALVAGDYATNLPPLNSNLVLSPKVMAGTDAGAPVIRCEPAGDKISVTVATQSGQTYQVQALDAHRAVQQAQTVMAQGASATVTFNAATLPNPVFFRATATP